MDKALYDQVHAVFMEACALVPAELGPFLARVADPQVRDQVEALLGYLSAEEPFAGPPPADDPVGLLGVVLDGRYRVEGYVTEGGFSHVYRGEHLAWGLPVAVKVAKRALPIAETRDLQAAFVREGALMARLSRQTTAVVQAFDVGTWHDPRGHAVTYTVMEWLDGAPLSEILERERRRWPLDEVLALLDPIAEALAIAHREDIAHRDIKPDNIFVVRSGPDPQVKLLDFGVAKVAALLSRGFDSTSSGVSPFTVRYATPEHVSPAQGPTGPRTDVFALALVCAELLAGRPPYDDGSNRDVLAQVLDAKRRPTPRTLGVRLPAPVERVFQSALALEPARRPPDVAAWWGALRAAARRRSRLALLLGG